MLKKMTRKEWMEQNHPDMVEEQYSGGVCGCPDQFKELDYKDGECNAYGHRHKGDYCDVCWSQMIAVEVPATNARCSIWRFIKEVFGRV